MTEHAILRYRFNGRDALPRDPASHCSNLATIVRSSV